MDTKTERALDVLVVGAGPTGMLLACALVHHGLHVRIIDAGKGPTLASKAQVLQTRTLEILEQLGFVTRFLERGQPLHLLSMYNQEMKRLFHIIVGELDSRYPFMLSLPQRETEQLLSEALQVNPQYVQGHLSLGLLERPQHQKWRGAEHLHTVISLLAQCRDDELLQGPEPLQAAHARRLASAGLANLERRS